MYIIIVIIIINIVVVFIMIRAKLGCHGGKVAMMWAPPTRHPGEARMMVAKRPRHGFAMIIAIISTFREAARPLPELLLLPSPQSSLYYHYQIN
jgi:hypothetical protein